MSFVSESPCNLKRKRSIIRWAQKRQMRACWCPATIIYESPPILRWVYEFHNSQLIIVFYRHAYKHPTKRFFVRSNYTKHAKIVQVDFHLHNSRSWWTVSADKSKWVNYARGNSEIRRLYESFILGQRSTLCVSINLAKWRQTNSS